MARCTDRVFFWRFFSVVSEWCVHVSVSVFKGLCLCVCVSGVSGCACVCLGVCVCLCVCPVLKLPCFNFLVFVSIQSVIKLKKGITVLNQFDVYCPLFPLVF